LKSTAFPVAHYLGSERSGPKVGSSVSKVYFANIAGSTLGPLITGFVLLDVLSLQQAFALMAALTAIVALWCLRAASTRPAVAAWAVVALVIGAFAWTPARLMPFLIQATRRDGSTLHLLVETRVGIIHAPGEADTTYGGNVYDGRVSVDFIQDENSI